MEPTIRIIRPQTAKKTVNDQSLKMVENISRLLDSQFTIPGTNIKFGLDPIFSMLPVLGDLITFLISGALIYTMRNQGASRKVVVKMMMNSTLDAVIGAIPIVGTFFDVFYRSNERNVKLLKEHYYEGKHHGSGNGLLILIGLICLVIVAAAFYGTYKLFEAIF